MINELLAITWQSWLKAGALLLLWAAASYVLMHICIYADDQIDSEADDE